MSSGRQIRALYRALLDQQLTKSRLLLVAGFSVLALVLALSIGSQVEPEFRTESVVGFLSVYGLGFMVPILSLLFASTTLGQLVEDETLVYLWLRPNPRWQLALAAWAASATIALPIAVFPLAASAAIGTGGDGSIVAATALSMGLAAIGYSGLFVLLGLVFRRALLWGLVYIFIWELFVARAGAGAARLSTQHLSPLRPGPSDRHPSCPWRNGRWCPASWFPSPSPPWRWRPRRGGSTGPRSPDRLAPKVLLHVAGNAGRRCRVG